MSIDKIIKKLLWFEDYNEEDYCGGDRIQDEHGEWFYKVTEEDFEAFRQAADVLRKYQKLEQEPTTKNDLGVDAVNRKEVINQIFYSTDNNGDVVLASTLRERIARLPSVTPQEPKTFKWCTDCKEYDQEKHCCHRWSKVIRDTVEEMKQEQEPRKGHWITRPHVYGVTYCSECDFELKIDNTNYCPNCGAKMVEPRENDGKE